MSESGQGLPTDSEFVPFNRPFLAGNELIYMADAVRRGHLSGDGHYGRVAAGLLAELLGTSRILLTPSCTSALELAFLVAGVEPGDEVIVPSYTFPSTANAFILRGAVPRFVDIREDTLNLDESQLESARTSRTRFVVPVHYAGVGAEMDEVLPFAGRHGISVIEDAAQGLGGAYRERPLGTFGRFAAISFHETKNIQCGEGGALIVRDAGDFERAEIARVKGTDRSRFLRGEVDKYSWVDHGSNAVLSDILAAFLAAQLERAGAIQGRRLVLWQRYLEAFAPLAEAGWCRLPSVPAHCRQNAHIFYLVCEDAEERTRLIERLAGQGINAVFHYQALHAAAMGRRYGYAPGDLPVAERMSDCLVRLPLHLGLLDEQQERVIEQVRAFYGAGRRALCAA